MTEGVAQEIGDDLLGAGRVDVQAGQVVRRGEIERHPRRLRGGLKARDRIAKQLPEVRWLAVQPQLPRLREGQCSEIVNQPRKGPRAVEQRSEVLVVRRMDAVKQRLEAALDDAERRS